MRAGDGEGQIRRKTLPRLAWPSQSPLYSPFIEDAIAVGIGEDDAETTTKTCPCEWIHINPTNEFPAPTCFRTQLQICREEIFSSSRDACVYI